MAAKLSFVLVMDYPFFCVYSAMPYILQRYLVICLLSLPLISCNENSKVFRFEPDARTVYHFTIAMDETAGQQLENLPPPTSKQYSFALQLHQLIKGAQVFNMAYESLSVTTPHMIAGKRADGSIEVQSGANITLSTDSATNYSRHINDIRRTNWYEIMPGIIGDSVKVMIDKNGRVSDAWAYEPIRDKITAATRKDSREVSRQIREYVSPEAVTDIVNSLFWYLPGREIKEGEQWVSNIEYRQHAPVKHSHNITVRSINNDTVHLNVQTVVSGRLGQGRLITSGKMEGTIAASISTGMPYNMDLTENIVMHTDRYDVYRKRNIHLHMHQSPAR